MAFEDMIAYGIIAIIFIVGFMPVLADFVTQAQSVAEPKTAMVLGFLIPFILIIIVVGLFFRIKGDRNLSGEW